MRHVIAAALIALGASHAQAQAQGPNQEGDRQRDIAYGSQPAQMLDFYPSASPAPLVVYVHGGGWNRGDKNSGRRIAHVLHGEGYAVASVNYRLLGEGTVQDQARDVAHASAYLMANASHFGIDPRRFALLGHSAGGHLVALVGADPAYLRQAGLESGKLAVVITLDGVFNLEAAAARRGNHLNLDAQEEQLLSPINRLDGAAARPAFCLLHEDTVPRFTGQADAFDAALRAHGLTVDEGTVHGLNHVELVGRFNDPGTETPGLVSDCLKRFLHE